MANQYYSYLNSPSFLRLGTVNGSPKYMNIGQWLPWYGMSLMEGSTRQYSTETGKMVAKIVDSDYFPAKDPIGQFALDYFILPTVTGEALGKFGQTLYPTDANFLEKGLYAMRGALETVMPKAIAYTAPLIAPFTDLTPQQVEASPIYYWRKLYNAIKGRGPTGFMKAQSDPGTEFLTGLGSMAGFPIKTLYKDYSLNQTEENQ